MSKAVKIKMYKMIMKPVAVCGSETWAMTEMDIKERKVLRSIQRPMVEQGVWRIITNQELRELCMSNVVTDIKKKRLEWIGHVERMDQGRTV